MPGETSLTAVESGTNAPTATTLSFTIECAEAYPGFPITDFKVHAVTHRDYPPRVERTYFFPDKKCGSNGPVTLTGLPLRKRATTWRVRAQARAIRGHTGPWSQTAELATLADPAQQSAAALTASFAGVPSAHTGNERTFSFTVNFNVSVDGGQVPTKRSFETSEGRVTQVVRASGTEVDGACPAGVVAQGRDQAAGRAELRRPERGVRDRRAGADEQPRGERRRRGAHPGEQPLGPGGHG